MGAVDERREERRSGERREERRSGEREEHGSLPALELPARRGVSWSRSVGAKGGTIAQEVAPRTIATLALAPTTMHPHPRPDHDAPSPWP